MRRRSTAVARGAAETVLAVITLALERITARYTVRLLRLTYPTA